ncbi:MAG: tripartite tricarboxylate transporter substrate binding protein [Burkholderiales bacterium]|nr:tripartite tricarboxylate transporter substrate binding protein [Burkholderiales bacterium]
MILSRCLAAARLLAAAGALAAASVVSAQGFPARPIQLINPYPAGGFADNVARVVAQEAAKVLGQSIVVENRPGASGKIGLEAVLGAPRDGYTIGLAVPASLSLFPVTDPKYANLHSRISPVTMAVRGYLALAINPAVVPARNIRDFAEWLKANQGKASYGSAGQGTSYHLWAEAFNLAAGVTPVHVPYKGEAPSITDLIGGQIHFAMVTGAAKPHVDAGKLMVLAVTGAERWTALYPSAPTFRESGFPQVEASGWLGIIAPAEVPAEVIGRLHAAFVQALKAPAVEKALAAQGYSVVGSTPEFLLATARREAQTLGEVIRARGIKLD